MLMNEESAMDEMNRLRALHKELSDVKRGVRGAGFDDEFARSLLSKLDQVQQDVLERSEDIEENIDWNAPPRGPESDESDESDKPE